MSIRFVKHKKWQFLKTCHVIMTLITTPKRLTPVHNSDILDGPIENGSVYLRCMSLRYEKHKSFERFDMIDVSQ
jgi:hypothetical protein